MGLKLMLLGIAILLSGICLEMLEMMESAFIFVLSLLGILTCIYGFCRKD